MAVLLYCYCLFLSYELVFEFIVLTSDLLADSERCRHIAVLINSSCERYTQSIGCAGCLVKELVAIVGVPDVRNRGGVERCFWAGECDVSHIGSTASFKCYRTAVCLAAVITSTGPCAAVCASRTLGCRLIVVDAGIIVIVATCYECAAKCESGYC